MKTEAGVQRKRRNEIGGILRENANPKTRISKKFFKNVGEPKQVQRPRPKHLYIIGQIFYFPLRSLHPLFRKTLITKINKMTLM